MLAMLALLIILLFLLISSFCQERTLKENANERE